MADAGAHPSWYSLSGLMDCRDVFSVPASNLRSGAENGELTENEISGRITVISLIQSTSAVFLF